MSLQKELENNWAKEAENYSKSVKQEDLDTNRRWIWTNLILENAPKKETMDILDVGTGPGFFSIILEQAGHRATGVDCTKAMIEKAQANAQREGVSPQFLVADGEQLPFPDGSFDCIVSRNVTWTLLDAQNTYQEWLRLLRPQGRILIFDANWNLRYHNTEFMKKYEEDARIFEDRFGHPAHILTQDGEEYRKKMPLCRELRPQWDFDIFAKLRVRQITCHLDITELVWDEKRKVKYRSTPMFMIVVEK